jgi:hypothetical protein
MMQRTGDLESSRPPNRASVYLARFIGGDKKDGISYLPKQSLHFLISPSNRFIDEEVVSKEGFVPHFLAFWPPKLFRAVGTRTDS